MAIFRRESQNRKDECRWVRQKSRFWVYIWLHCVMLTLLPARCYQYGAARPRSCKLWHITCSKRRSSMAGKDDEMFTTRSFNVTPKTTKQHLIARSDKSAAYVTNNERLCSTFSTIKVRLPTDTKHRAASLRQQSYLYWHCCKAW